jgi:hypothetical protein
LYVVEVNVFLILIFFVVVNVIDYVDVVFADDDDEILSVISIVILIVYVDDVLPMMIEIDHVVYDDVIFHHYCPKNKNKIQYFLMHKTIL